MDNEKTITEPQLIQFIIQNLERNIDILIADETLSVGVNLPVRSVIIVGDIDMTNYTHMGGRAGRRGIDDQRGCGSGCGPEYRR